MPLGNSDELPNKYYFYKWSNLCFILVMFYEKGNVQLVHYLEIFGVHFESLIQSSGHRIPIKHNGSHVAKILQSSLKMYSVLCWR